MQSDLTFITTIHRHIALHTDTKFLNLCGAKSCGGDRIWGEKENVAGGFIEYHHIDECSATVK